MMNTPTRARATGEYTTAYCGREPERETSQEGSSGETEQGRSGGVNEEGATQHRGIDGIGEGA